MEIKFIESKRVMKIIADGKHVKSLPLVLSFAANYVTEHTIKNFKKGKTMQQSDKNLLSEYIFPILLFEWDENLKKDLPRIHELVKSGKAIATRKVNVRHLSETRFEIQFEDKKYWFVIDKMMYDYSGNIQNPTVNLNY